MVRLTDHELAAIGVRQGKPWPAQLPTIDTGDSEAVILAAEFGERSLFARELIDEDTGALLPEFETSLRPALQGLPALTLYTGDQDANWFPDGPNATYHAHEGVVLMESSSPGGVHEFGLVDPGDARESLLELLGAAWQFGVAAEPEQVAANSAFFVRVLNGTRVEQLRVSQGLGVLESPEGSSSVTLEAARSWLAASW